jgi:hypothetical protein
MFALGDPKLTPYEANFVNGIKQRLQFDPMYISKKQENIIDQIKEKLGYNSEHGKVVEEQEPEEIDMEVDEFGNWTPKNQYHNGFDDNDSDGAVVVEELRPR